MAYNHERYIRKTLEGFVNQETTFGVEYIVHDDASSDSTAIIIREFASKYPDLIKPIYQTENQYSRGTRMLSRIQEKIDSRYTAVCEGDDYWIDNKKLQKQIDYMETHPECSLTIHNGFRLNDKTGQLKPLNPYNHEGILSMNEVLVEVGGMIPTASMVFRTEIIKRIPKETFSVPGVGDRPKRMYLATQGSVYYFHEKMSVYRTNNVNSFGGIVASNREKSYKLLKDMLDFFERFDIYTNQKYSNDIKMVKSREEYLYFIRERKYSKAAYTDYYRQYTSWRSKVKDFIKWKLPEPILDLINRLVAKL